MRWPYGMHGNVGFGGMGWGDVALGIVVLILVALFIVLIVKAMRGPGQRYWASRSDALEIAKERYAKGEINSEQFQEIKKTLL